MSTATLFSDITTEADAIQLVIDALGGRVIEEVPERTWREFDDREDYNDRLANELAAVELYPTAP